MPDFEYDAFISHATEDKTSFVEPLALELRKMGLNIWFDKFSLRVGDSLRKSIEDGLTKSRYGVVICSSSFFAKNWTQSELSGLFAFEMSGRKVILPVWHQISSEEMRRQAPMLSDMVALRSSDGATSVARALAEVIRPEIFSLEYSKHRVQLATIHLKEEIEKKHPGYDVRISSGSVLSFEGIRQSTDGVVVSRSDGTVRIDVFVGDVEQIEKNPPHMNLSFSGDGISKIQEGIRTGKPQRFLSGEYSYRGGNMPLVPEEGFPEGTELQMQSQVRNGPSQQVRLVVTTESIDLEIPILNMKPTRGGTEEVEIQLSHHTSPLRLTMTITPNPGDRDVNLAVSFAGFNFNQISHCIQVVSAILNGCELRLYDIATGKAIFHGALNELKQTFFPDGIITLVEMVRNIENHFDMAISWPSDITEDDATIAHILNSLVTGEEYGTNFTASLTIIKTSVNSPLDLMLQGPVLSFQEPPQSEGFKLFNKEIPTEPWGFYTEQVVLEDPDLVRASLAEVPDGETITVAIKGITPTYVRWKHTLG